jgi:hypothetical protein
MIKSIFDKNTKADTENSMQLQTNINESEILKLVLSSSDNHGVEVQELSFEDVARIMAGK